MKLHINVFMGKMFSLIQILGQKYCQASGDYRKVVKAFQGSPCHPILKASFLFVRAEVGNISWLSAWVLSHGKHFRKVTSVALQEKTRDSCYMRYLRTQYLIIYSVSTMAP